MENSWQGRKKLLSGSWIVDMARRNHAPRLNWHASEDSPHVRHALLFIMDFRFLFPSSFLRPKKKKKRVIVSLGHLRYVPYAIYPLHYLRPSSVENQIVNGQAAGAFLSGYAYYLDDRASLFLFVAGWLVLYYYYYATFWSHRR